MKGEGEGDGDGEVRVGGGAHSELTLERDVRLEVREADEHPVLRADRRVDRPPSAVVAAREDGAHPRDVDHLGWIDR